MKRNWNWSLWIGFLLALAGLFSYEFFVQFPITRDFPWANLLLFAAGGILLILGLARAFGRPQLYRGKIFGSVFALLSVLVFTFFDYELFYVVRHRSQPQPARRESVKRRRSLPCRTRMGNRLRWLIWFRPMARS
jgi:peptidoglycan/LPS O-acetylase OafA/YrhL